MPLGDFFGWPAAHNGIGDGKVLFGKGERPDKAQFIQDALAGTTVAMILVPEAVAFAFMAGLKPLVGLQAAWIMCLVAGLLGDRPAMISGATGAVAVVLPAITQVNLCTDYLVQREVADPGFSGNLPAGWPNDCESPSFATPRRLGVMFYAVMLQGVLQFVFGIFKLGKFALLLPESCMVGFVNGLGIIIFFAQFGHFKRGEIGISNPLYCQTAFDKDSTGAEMLAEENTDGSKKFPGVGMTVAQWCDTAREGWAECCSQQTDHDGNPFSATWETAAAADTGRRQLAGSHAVLSDGEPWHDTETLMYMLFALIIPVIISIHLAPKIFEKIPPWHNAQMIPSSLVGIGMSILIEHVIIRNIDSDCDLAHQGYDYDYSASEPRSLWIGCGTKTVKEVAMVAGKFPVPIWVDTDSYETFPGSGVKIQLKDAVPPIDGDLLSEIFSTSIFLAVIGLIESLMTQILLNQILGTPGDASRECVGQGCANFVAGAFGSMGGCVTIGQAMINVGSGSKLRFSCVWAAFVLLVIILVAYPIIDLVPVAGLVGVMFDMIAFHIFDWGSLKTMATALLPEKARGPLKLLQLKVTRVDSVTVVVVAIVSIFTNLAVGVGAGIVVCSLAFAWTHGKEIKLQDQDGKDIDANNIGSTKSTAFKELSPEEQKAVTDLGLTEDQWDMQGDWESAGEWPLGQYKDVAEKEAAGETVSDEEKTKANAAAELGFNIDNWATLAPKKITRTDMHVIGTMFFGSARVFSLLFTRPLLKACPKHIYMSFQKGEVTDFSAVAALQNLASMFAEEGTQLHLVQLSQDSHRMMEKSNKLLDNVSSMTKEEITLGADITHYIPNRPDTDVTEKSANRP